MIPGIALVKAPAIKIANPNGCPAIPYNIALIIPQITLPPIIAIPKAI